MLAAATGASWPRARRRSRCKQGIAEECPRRRAAPETSFHRIWGRESRSASPVYQLSEQCVGQACARAEAGPGRRPAPGTRGLLPSPRVAVEGPPDCEQWRVSEGT
eukprot:7968222-Pyramimonas_sp.AAC.1